MEVTLNISATSIRLLALKGGQVKKWASLMLEPGLVKDGVILQPEAVAAVINSLFKSTKFPREQVITSLTGLSFTYRVLSLPRMKPALIEEAIKRGASKEMPLPLEEMYLSWQAIDSGGDEVDYFVFGVPKNLIDTVAETLAAAEVKPYRMDLKPLALARAASKESALIVALEPDCFDIVLIANGIPAIMHNITPRGEGASIEDNIKRLTDELSKTVEFYNNSHLENPLSPTIPLLLTGELSDDAATTTLIQAETAYSVERLVPPLQFPSYLSVALYAANMGLALRKAPQNEATSFQDICVNLLSAKQRARAQPLPIRYILVPLALIIAVVVMFALNQARSQAASETISLQTDLNQLSQELHQARLAAVEAEQIKETTEATIGEITAEVESLREGHQLILSRGGDFTDILKMVYTAFPSEAHFTSIDIGADQIAVEGVADNPFAVVSYAMVLETQGFSEVRIAEINDSSVTETETTEPENTGVSFKIVISK